MHWLSSLAVTHAQIPLTSTECNTCKTIRDLFLLVSSGSCVARSHEDKELVHNMDNGDDPSHTVLVTVFVDLFSKGHPTTGGFRDIETTIFDPDIVFLSTHR